MNVKSNQKNNHLSRRHFLKRVGTVAGAAMVPSLVPSSILGADSPSNRIVMGAIGVGSMGTGDLNAFLSKREVQMVALCDVDTNHMNNAVRLCNERYKNKDAKGYIDFRELLERKDLDAVQIVLPDHWHAIPAIAAAQKRLDIFGQKPLARSIREGRAICQAVERYGIVWQTGSQQRSDQRFRHACELVRNGRIGKITHVEVGLPTGGGSNFHPVQPVPKELDWDRWLGPAPKVPYRGVCHYNWRWIQDYSGGQLTDWAGHHIDIAHWGLGFDETGPDEIEGKGEYPTDGGIYNVPMNYNIKCTYKNGVVFRISNSFPMGAKWYGEDGWVHVNRSGIWASNPALLRETIGANETKLYESWDHKQNFLDCIKTRKPCVCPAETGLRSISVGLLGEIAMLTGRKIKWNPETEQIIGDPAASALLGRSYRLPYCL